MAVVTDERVKNLERKLKIITDFIKLKSNEEFNEKCKSLNDEFKKLAEELEEPNC